VVARAGDLKRIELEHGQSIDDRHHALGLGRQCARRVQEMAINQISAGSLFRELDGQGRKSNRRRRFI